MQVMKYLRQGGLIMNQKEDHNETSELLPVDEKKEQVQEHTLEENKAQEAYTYEETQEEIESVQSVETLEEVVTSEAQESIEAHIVEESIQPIEDDNKILKEKPSRSFKQWMAGVAVASLCAGLGIGIGFSFAVPFQSAYYEKVIGHQKPDTEAFSTMLGQNDFKGSENTADFIEEDGSVVSIARHIGPSVVSVYNNKKVTSELNMFYSTEDAVVTGLGSGIIFTEDETYYYIMTNSHVVEGADSLAVNFLGDIKAEAKLVGKDSFNDIAVVKVQKEKLSDETRTAIRLAPLGDSEKIEVGQLALAIGTPATQALNNTVTRGIISAVERNITIGGHTMKVIQTDAAISPGNSGGALVGPSGEIIGMNVAKTVNAEGIGFAIPINKVKEVVVDLMAHGSVQRPALGITGIEVSSSQASLYDLPIGIYIESVIKGGSADLAGIQAEDVLIQFEGQMITTMTQLKALIAEKRVGDLAEVKVIRSGMQKTFKIELKEMPES